MRPILAGDVPKDIELKSIGEQLDGMAQNWTTKQEPGVHGQPKMTKLESQLMDFIKSGGDKTLWPTALQSKFAREVAKGTPLHEKQKALKTYAQKSEFKVKWCQKVYDHLQEGKKHTHSYRQANIKHGVHYNYGRLCEEYGIHADREKAIQAGTRHATKAIKMGGNWTTKDAMSGELMFFFLRQEYHEEMAEMWEMYEQENGAQEEGEAAPITAAAVVATASITDGQQAVDKTKIDAVTVMLDAATAVDKTKIEGGSEATGAGHIGGDGPGNGDGGAGGRGGGVAAGVLPKRKTEFDEVLSAANKLKVKYNATTNAAASMLHLIGTSKEWAWADNPHTSGELGACLAELRDSIDHFGQAFLSGDFKDVRIGHEVQFLTGALHTFTMSKQKVDALQAKVNLINRMKKATVV